MEQHEYIAEFRPDGALTIHGGIKGQFAVGEKVRVILEPIMKSGEKPIELMDTATKMLLQAIDNAENIGSSDDAEEFRHSVLFEERMEEKLS